MVFYFTSNVVSPPAMIYMGRDKNENEELIKWGWPEDIWFHVDDLSSAHVYLRLPEGQGINDITGEVLTECAQLTKANSITGCKLNDVRIVYTPWENLKKTGDMVVGQVGFHSNKAVKYITVPKKINDIINRLNRTKVEKDPDFRVERDERDRKVRLQLRRVQQEEQNRKKEEEKLLKEEADKRSYSNLMSEENMSSNKDCAIDEDDFM